MKKFFYLVLTVLMTAAIIWVVHRSESTNSLPPQGESAKSQAGGAKVEKNQSPDPFLGVAEKADSEKPKPAKVQTIKDYKLIPSSVGGLVAIELPDGKQFIQSVTKVQYKACHGAPNELCIGYRVDQEIKVSAELRKHLPPNVEYYLGHPDLNVPVQEVSGVE